ncbi:rod-determining factor RdfA [Halococcus qingdaonensis]|uniref:rod-determining factor RdfA n=1 Tax=Halococcus qingdaonensis TaxID=224402 RepID=UPI002115D519|nr:rod-determining factor RdfA [Halococcus qingdaonensis]
MTDANDPDSSDDAGSDSNSKVVRVLQRYELVGLGDELVEYWTGEATERKSLRELADYFNRELLARVLRDASVDTLDGEQANLYRLLTDEDVSSGAAVQAINRLEQHGVDVDQLTADFVSRQAIHTYLTSYRDVSYSSSHDDPVETETTNVRRLRRRMTTIVESKIERLRNTGRITLGAFNVLIDVRVLCEDCGAQYQVTELFDRGGCECTIDSSDSQP